MRKPPNCESLEVHSPTLCHGSQVSAKLTVELAMCETLQPRPLVLFMCMCTVQVQARLANKLYFSATCFSVLPIFFWPRKSQLFLEGSYKLQNRLTSNHCGAYIHACPARFLAQKTSDILGKRNKLLACVCTKFLFLFTSCENSLVRFLSEQKGARLALHTRGTKPFPMYSKLQLCSFPSIGTAMGHL